MSLLKWKRLRTFLCVAPGRAFSPSFQLYHKPQWYHDRETHLKSFGVSLPRWDIPEKDLALVLNHKLNRQQWEKNGKKMEKWGKTRTHPFLQCVNVNIGLSSSWISRTVCRFGCQTLKSILKVERRARKMKKFRKLDLWEKSEETGFV